MALTTNALLTAALERNDYRLISVIPPHLWNDIELKYVTFIREHFNRYSQLPPLDLFIEKNPAFRLEHSEFTTLYIFDEISNLLEHRFLEREISERLDRGENVYDKNLFSELAAKARIPSLNVLDYNQFDRTEYFRNIKRMDFNLPWFDESLGGLVGGDLGFIFGRMKSGKTTIQQIIQRALYKFSNAKILAFSNELPPIQFAGKLDSMEGQFNPKVFRTGDFDEQTKEKLIQIGAKARQRTSNITIAGRANSHEDVLAFYLNMQEKPDVITIDGVELMGKMLGNAAERSYNLGAIAYGLKQIAVEYEIPIIGTLQQSRAGKQEEDGDTSTVAGSDQFARACDWLIGVRQIEQNGVDYHRLYTAANRHGATSVGHIHIDWSKMRVSFHDLLEDGSIDFSSDSEYREIQEFVEAKQQIGSV